MVMRGVFMWDAKKSIILSQIFGRIIMLGTLIMCIGLDFIIKCFNGHELYNWIGSSNTQIVIDLTMRILIYLAGTIIIIALLLLDSMLSNIKTEKIFIYENVKKLRYISWCAFILAAVIFGMGMYYKILILAGIIMIFIGTVLRVVKNVIEQAVLIKTENDFTI